MKTILCSNGTPVLVDDADFETVSRFNWYAQRYPFTVVKGKQTRMHRFLIGEAATGMIVDHRNGDRFDNRRDNLRVTCKYGNARNRAKNSGACSSKFKGVDRRGEKWRAKITVEKRVIHLGYFTSEIEAALVYDTAARQHFGPFARLNFPQPTEQAA